MTNKFPKLIRLLTFNMSDLKITEHIYGMKYLCSGTIESGEFLFKKAKGYWQIDHYLIPHFQCKNKLNKYNLPPTISMGVNLNTFFVKHCY